MNDGHRIDFRIVHSFGDAYEGLGTVCYRAGFEDQEHPEAFVVQLEGTSGYDGARESVEWTPIARFDHGRPHNVFDPDEGNYTSISTARGCRSTTTTTRISNITSDPVTRSVPSRVFSRSSVTGRTGSMSPTTTEETSAGSTIGSRSPTPPVLCYRIE